MYVLYYFIPLFLEKTFFSFSSMSPLLIPFSNKIWLCRMSFRYDPSRKRSCFERSVRLNGARLVVKLKPAFDQRSTTLLDKLTRLLRARLPLLETLQYEKGSEIRTIIINRKRY